MPEAKGKIILVKESEYNYDLDISGEWSIDQVIEILTKAVKDISMKLAEGGPISEKELALYATTRAAEIWGLWEGEEE